LDHPFGTSVAGGIIAAGKGPPYSQKQTGNFTRWMSPVALLDE
jgi:hypothetical protein